ncbi:MAG TPA: FMN-binding negative transcriptional regulator [Leptolyngbyaceae cyanobacterium]
MYRPTAFREDDVDKLVSFMKAHSFATLVSVLNGVPSASHVPLVVKVENDTIKLIGHLAKQNPQWQAFEAAESLAIFTGPHAYISPTLYEKHESVPTWNYIAVHAYGFPKIITFGGSPESMDKMIDEMVDTYEDSYKQHWHSLSTGFREGLMNGIIGFEMTVTRLEGKYKLSQNRSQADQQNVSDSLLQSSDSTVRAVGAEMKQNLDLGR